MSLILVCDGQIELSVAGYATCDTGWESAVYTAQFSTSSIDPEVATTIFAGGFLLFLVPWAIAWGVKQMLSLLR